MNDDNVLDSLLVGIVGTMDGGCVHAIVLFMFEQLQYSSAELTLDFFQDRIEVQCAQDDITLGQIEQSDQGRCSQTGGQQQAGVAESAQTQERDDEGQARMGKDANNRGFIKGSVLGHSVRVSSGWAFWYLPLS